MLVSMVNMKLRDEYSSLDDFCGSADIDREALESRLSEAGFEYAEENNQFRSK